MRSRIKFLLVAFVTGALVLAGTSAMADTSQSNWTSPTSISGRANSFATIVATPAGDFLSIVRNPDNAIQIFKSADGGQTWASGPVLASGLDQYAWGSIATNGDGTYLATWTSGSTGSYRVDASISSDGQTWSTPQNLVSGQSTAGSDALAVSPNGDAVVATSGSFYRYHGGTWTSASYAAGTYVGQVAVNSLGRYVAVAWTSSSRLLYSSVDGSTWNSSTLSAGQSIDGEVAPVVLANNQFLLAGEEVTGTSPNQEYRARTFIATVDGSGGATVSESGQVVAGTDESSFSSLVQTASGTMVGLVIHYAPNLTGALSVYSSTDGLTWGFVTDLAQMDTADLEHTAKLATDANGNLVAANRVQTRNLTTTSKTVVSWSSTDIQNWSAPTTLTTTAGALNGPRPAIVVASQSGNFVVGWATDVWSGSDTANAQSYLDTSSTMFYSVSTNAQPAVGQPVAGQVMSASLSGLRPGSTLSMEVHSTPTTFGSATVGANGSATVSGALPASLSPGSHSIYLAGVRSDGTQFSELISTFYVSKSGTVVDESTALAATGVDVTALAWLGVLIGLLGLVLTALVRRKTVAGA